MRFVWASLAALVLSEIAYPLVEGAARARFVVVTVLLGYTASVAHAAATRGVRAALFLVAVTTGGGFAVEAVGVATCVPFGCYAYGPALGPRLVGVSWVIPLAWTWLAWPAWLAAGRLAVSLVGRIGVAGLALAAWDLFLDPQMVAEGYWRWRHPHPALPGVAAVPVGNYLAWLAVAVAMMALLAAVPALRPVGVRDAPMLALYLWTYASSVVAHALFLGLSGAAAWGAVVMGLVAVPLGVRLWVRPWRS
jgi:uncharacterized membrane protein